MIEPSGERSLPRVFRTGFEVAPVPNVNIPELVDGTVLVLLTVFVSAPYANVPELTTGLDESAPKLNIFDFATAPKAKAPGVAPPPKSKPLAGDELTGVVCPNAKLVDFVVVLPKLEPLMGFEAVRTVKLVWPACTDAAEDWLAAVSKLSLTSDTGAPERVRKHYSI